MIPKEYVDGEIENSKLPVKTVVIILLWIGSLMTVYFKMQSSVDNAQAISQDALAISKATQDKWNASNISLLTYRVDQLQSSVDELKKNTKTHFFLKKYI